MNHQGVAYRCIDRIPLRMLTSVFAIAFVCFLSGCSTPLYVAKLGWGQAGILLHSKPNQTVLNDPTVKESVKEKIRLVIEAKTYGEEQIGLAETSSFSRFYQVEGPSLLYLVSASPRDRLEPYQWWFPITGRVTAKGFFRYEDALREADRLERRGFDIFLQGAQAYSTLGWFKDPIFSTMLRQDPALIVNVVIHELTHATVFFKNQLDFNEQLASFVGGQGAIDFVETKFGPGSVYERRATGLLEDGVLFAGFMKGVHHRLDEFYSGPGLLSEKLRGREAVFRQVKTEFETLKGQLKTDFYEGFEAIDLNNAVVLALGRYVANIEQIQRVYETLDRDLKRTVAFFVRIRKRGVTDPQGYVAGWLREKESEDSVSRKDGPGSTRQ